MHSINQNLSRAERIALATAFAQEVFDTYPVIESIYIFGSTVRGDSLPVSDLDMHYVLPRAAAPLPLEKAPRNGVFIDIEAYAKEDLTAEAVLGDAYVFGLVSDCIVLCDRTGFMAELKRNVAQDDSPGHFRSRVRKLVEAVRRNLGGFERAIGAMDHAEVCRCSGFVMWCLADYLIARHGRSPGGFRTLSRVKSVNTDAYLEILKLQDSLARSAEELASYNDFSSAWWNQQKSEWMFHNGLKDEAFHTLWICLALEVKGAEAGPGSADEQQLISRCRGWLGRLGWDTEEVLRRKAAEMDRVASAYGA